ncbi:MAG: two-partner secretion domain-containing protein [Planctomycetota bacterium]|jgi:filamentous hemagglutinin family protein
MHIAAKILKRRHLSKGLVYLLTWCLVLNTSLPLALALEAIDVTGASGVLDTTWGDHTVIDTDHGAIMNWNNFNTSSAQSVTFNQYQSGQLSSASAVLNRISSGAVPTQFNGALNANGRVFVVNPAGIVFGAGSTVNVSQLVASGLGMSDGAFNAILADPASQMAFEGGAGEVRNLGSISADSVYMVGKKVTNVGSVKAPEGLVVMAAGDNVYLAQDGSNVVVELAAESTGPGADVQNRSLISAANGKIVLAAGDSFSGAVSNAGVLAASAGEVTIEAASIENGRQH